MSRVKKSRGSKFIALVVALTFLLSVAAPAFAAAPADLQQSEAARLQTLGIIAGFPDGTLGLDQTMTRAQFAKVITIATGNEIIADAMVNSPTSFSDAKVGVWYTGYVNVASELGYILGYPDGTFKPNEPITNAEVLTILLRALGYDDRLPGSWPTDYLVKANELGISDDVTFAAKAAALRGDAFIFTSRTLDTNMVKWDGDAGEFVERDPATTLLAKAFEGTSDEGVLVDLQWDGAALTATLATVNDDDEVDTADFEVVSTPVISGAEGILGLLAKEVSYITNSDDEIIYFGVKDTDTVTDDTIAIDGDEATIDDDDYDVIDNCDLFAFPGEVPEASDGTYTADRVTAVLDGGDIMAVLFEEYEAPGIVAEVDDEFISVVDGSVIADVDLEDEDYAVIKDGALASLADLEAGDLIYAPSDVHGLDYLIVAVGQDNAITGTLEKANDDFSKITVDGTEYDVDSDAIASSDSGDSYDNWPKDASDFMGEDVAILFSPAGKVAAITSGFEAEAGLYGILLGAEYVGFNEYQVKLLTAAGDEVIYDLDEDEVDVDSNGNEVNSLNDAEVYDLIEYSFNSAGEIDSIEAIKNDNVKVQDTDKDNDRIKLDDSWYRVTDTTAFFVYDNADGTDWTTVSWNTFADIDVPSEDVYVDYVADGNTLSALRYPDEVTAIGDYGVILDSGHNPDGAYYELIVFGDVVTYNLANEDAFNPDVVGEVYSFELNADNEITLADDEGAPEGVITESGTVDAFSARNYIEVDDEYYDLDDETSIVDVTDPANPEVKTSVGKGKTVELYIDEDGFVDYILIVPEEEEEEEVIEVEGTVTYISGGVLEVTPPNDTDTFVVRIGETIKSLDVNNRVEFSGLTDGNVYTAELLELSSMEVIASTNFIKEAADFATVASIDTQTNYDITVDYDTAVADAIAELAPTTTIKDSEGNELVVDLTWSIPGYNATTAGDYTATGVITSLPIGVAYATGEDATDYQVTATVTVAENTDATLSNLTIDGTTVAGFNADTEEYTVVLPEGTTDVPAVAGIATDSTNATVVVTDATDLSGTEAERTTTVKVTAADGETTKTYTVLFVINNAPTVANAIDDITAAVAGGNITVNLAGVFTDADGDELTYTVTVTSDTDSIITSAIEHNGEVIIVPEGINTGTATIQVEASDGVDSVTDSFDVTLS